MQPGSTTCRALKRGQRSRAILARLGIPEDRIGQPLENMSRGMQQKVAIARAFLTAPIVLLLDEPTTGLDPRSKIDVQTFVEELREVHDATILITTHDMDEAEALCDRVAIIDKGRIMAMGTVEELKHAVTERMERDNACHNERSVHALYRCSSDHRCRNRTLRKLGKSLRSAMRLKKKMSKQ